MSQDQALAREADQGREPGAWSNQGLVRGQTREFLGAHL